MATLDEILGTSGSEGMGDEVYSQQVETKAEKKPADAKPGVVKNEQTEQPKSMVELYNALNPYTPPSEEDIEKEKKKQNREQIFAAIGDGIAALSNLFFTTKGAPSMYDGSNTFSGANKVRYDRLRKEREDKNMAYFNGYMKAKQFDDAVAESERNWKRQLGLDEKADKRYKESIEHRNEREKIADDRYDAEQTYRKERDQKNDNWKNEEFEYRKGRDRVSDNHWWANFKFQKQAHTGNVNARRDAARAAGARGVRGKQLGFADGKGNQVSIYENVWKGSMQQVYDVLLNDLAPKNENERKLWERQMKKLDTPQKKEDYVKQNWHRSPRASAIMLSLSKLDPATMTSELNGGDEDYSQYETGSGDDDFSEYEVK